MLFSQYFSREDFHQRRLKLVESMPDRSSLVVFAAEQKYRNSDVEYKFRQNSNFWYLTGFNETDAVLVLTKNTDKDYTETLFIQDKDPTKEIWTGIRAGQNATKEFTGIENIHRFYDFLDMLPKILGSSQVLYFDYICPEYQTLKTSILQIVKNKRIQHIHNINTIIGELRLYKEPKEIELLKRSAEINVLAHTRVLQQLGDFKYEYEIQAELEYIFRKHNADWAYTSIVASGANSTILHYTDNESYLREGELLLIDAGCELEYYASDITRTIPISGEYSGIQKDLYTVVHSAKQSAIQEYTSPNATFDSVSDAAIYQISKGLQETLWSDKSVDEIIECKLYQKYFMHKIGHWLGLDVHDIGSYLETESNKSRKIEPNMLITVEPGLYFAPDIEELPSEIRGVGIRIEDNILKVSVSSICNLTSQLPTEIIDLEGMINGCKRAGS